MKDDKILSKELLSIVDIYASITVYLVPLADLANTNDHY